MGNEIKWGHRREGNSKLPLPEGKSVFTRKELISLDLYRTAV